MFDIAEARAGLQQQRRDLQAECDANSKLQRRFDTISSQLRAATNGAPSAETVSASIDADNSSSSSSRSDVSNNFEFNNGSGSDSQEDMMGTNFDSQSGWQVEETPSSSISAVADGLDSKENI